MTDTLTDGRDILDSREIAERIAYLSTVSDEYGENMDDDMREELGALATFRDEMADYIPDWEYGETLISDSYFTEYAQELLTDCGYLPENLPAFIHIDWQWTAQEVRMDYTSAELAGVTYWAR